MLKPIISICVIAAMLFGCSENSTNNKWQWESISVAGQPIARHEAGFVAVDKKLYLIGGRRINQTSVFDTESQQWINLSQPPMELHHFQPVVYKGKIIIVGAMTGLWPNEKPVAHVITYSPSTDTYEKSHPIPEHRQRGATGTVVYNDKIYLVGGIKEGHQRGYVPWLDEYDPATGQWTVLDDAPQARDHFHAVTLKNKLYAFSGRKTSKATEQDMELTVAHGDVYDFTSKKWQKTSTLSELPTPRAGASTLAWNNHIVVGGGESTSQVEAHNEVEAFNTNTKQWTTWPQFQQGRHGTGFAIVDGYVYTASGSGKRGGEPELFSIERLKLPQSEPSPKNLEVQAKTERLDKHVYKQWHTVTLDFKGPETSEVALNNPFMHYKLMVEFIHQASDTRIKIPGYFAADGNAAQTSANAGDVWQVKFNPNLQGDWQYRATLYAGGNIAVTADYASAEQTSITNATGEFLVVATDKQGVDFKAQGRITAQNGYFQFEQSGEYWLKAGTNSPENLLGYADFDGTYRIDAPARDGEAKPNQTLHRFLPHLQDWRTGDPDWKHEKGRSLIGAINYLADQGMNSSYFLTMNILGDGKDVWPYVSHQDFTRFDVSKLAQWELVFEHMQAKGVLLHMVIQETENELMLDEGNTGPLRKLYLNELIARFGHHLGLVWNLGEENGYAKWSPNAQNTAQRKAMATHIKATDPYNHPVLLHTHAHDPEREDILAPLLGFKDIDGLSLQQDKREHVSAVISQWRERAKSAGHDWLITMDEIGMWHTAALPDSVDKSHDTLRRDVLWGSILSGAAGLEWYFGAKHPHNDLTSEDWRQRANLWKQTNIAKEFAKDYLPFPQLEPCSPAENISTWQHCAQHQTGLYVTYFSGPKNSEFKVMTAPNRDYDLSIKWFDPIKGGPLQTGSKNVLKADSHDLGLPPNTLSSDWVVLLTTL